MANVKGTNVIQVVRTLRKNRAHALEQLSPKLHGYLTERILPSSWYPERDQLGLLVALAALTPTADAWHFFGRMSARTDLTGVYRALLKPHEPLATLQNTAVLWRNFHDTGEMAAKREDATTALITLEGYAIVSADLCRLMSGYAFEAAQMSGGSDVAVDEVECRARGQSRCAWRVQWKRSV
jgi:hypothetical protein